MKLTVQGKGNVTITDRHFKFSGGEATIYMLNGVVYKIYHDPNDVPNVAKIQELGTLVHPAIVRPKNLLLDDKARPVGFTMDEVKDVVHTSRLFTTDFQHQFAITPDMITELVHYLRGVIDYIHQRGFLVVDISENNFLVSEHGYKTVYAIDTCSYQTPSFPATAFTVATRDYSNKKFSKLTDWYGFGIIACQLFIGIHPFKGTHPKFARNDFVSRMKAGVSIWNKDVRLPAVVRDFNMIPENYRDWMLRVFEKGDRLPPPDFPGALGHVVVAVSVPIETGNFRIGVIETYPDQILGYIAHNGLHAVLTTAGLKINAVTHPKVTSLVWTDKMMRPYAVTRTENEVVAENLENGTKISTPLSNRKIMTVGNRIYAISETRLIELTIVEMSNDALVVTQQWDLLPGFTEAYDRVIAIKALGQPYLVIPTDPGICQFVKFPELSGQRLVAAKYDNKVAILIGEAKGKLTRFIVRFAEDHNDYDVRKIEDVDTADINYIVLANGVVIHISEDGIVEVFSNRKGSSNIKQVSDPKITTKMRLVKDGVRAMFYQGKELCSISMKGP